MKIISIVGARPNFMKVAPLHKAFEASGKIRSSIVHTGQHYDARMSDIFFKQLNIPEPDFYLKVGSGTHAYQTAHVMLRLEELLLREMPDLVLVVGDVNATVAASLVAVKLGIKVVHVEAGLRSGDRKMPEEINRIVTDSISDLLFVTEESGIANLKHEGVRDDKVYFVGNVMIDSLIQNLEKARGSDIHQRLGVEPHKYFLMTMHRPHNVDHEDGLRKILEIIRHAAGLLKVVFPIHPRTEKNFRTYGLYGQLEHIPGVKLLEPQGYLDFLNLMENAKGIITDSGGIQEETTYLNVPCLTFRDTTERPVTVEIGSNILMKDLDPAKVAIEVEKIVSGNFKQSTVPPLWDGKAAERITEILLEWHQNSR